VLNSMSIISAFFIVQNAKAQMEFIENKGQWDNKVEYKGDFSTGSFFLENQGFTVLLHDVNDLNALSQLLHGHGPATPVSNQPITINSHAYKVKFLGSASAVQPVPDKVQPFHNNYFL
jgi:hypothetical protein